MSGIKTLLEKFAPEGESPAFLNPREENILMKAGGSGTISNNPFGIKSFAGWAGDDLSGGGGGTEVTGDPGNDLGMGDDWQDEVTTGPAPAPDVDLPAENVPWGGFQGDGKDGAGGSGGRGGSGGNDGDDLGFWDVLGAIPEVLASILSFGMIDLETTGKDIMPEFTDRDPQKAGIEFNPWNALNMVAPGIGSLITYATGAPPTTLIGGDDDEEIISGGKGEDKSGGASSYDLIDSIFDTIGGTIGGIPDSITGFIDGFDLTPGKPHGGGGTPHPDFPTDEYTEEHTRSIRPRVVAPAPVEVIEEEEVIPIYDYNKGYEPQDYYNYDPYSSGYVGEKRWPIVFGPGDYSEWDKI